MTCEAGNTGTGASSGAPALPITEAEYRAKLSDPTYRFTARRWRDHLIAFSDLDDISRRNVAQLIAYYDEAEAEDG